MASSLPSSLPCDSTVRPSFSDTVKRYLQERNVTEADLMRVASLSKTTASRIYRNSNDKGSTYEPTLRVVMAVSIGLQLTRKETKALLFCAFPQLELWGEFMDQRVGVTQADMVLFEQSLPLLSNYKEN